MTAKTIAKPLEQQIADRYVERRKKTTKLIQLKDPKLEWSMD